MLVTAYHNQASPIRYMGAGINVACQKDMYLRNTYRVAAHFTKKSTPTAHPLGSAVIPPIGAREYGGRTSAYASGESSIGGITSVIPTTAGTCTLVAQLNKGESRGGSADGAATGEAQSSIVGVLKAELQIGAQPSAFDIAQAVWAQSASGFTAAGTFGSQLRLAVPATKEDIADEILGRLVSSGLTVSQSISLLKKMSEGGSAPTVSEIATAVGNITDVNNDKTLRQAMAGITVTRDIASSISIALNSGAEAARNADAVWDSAKKTSGVTADEVANAVWLNPSAVSKDAIVDKIEKLGTIKPPLNGPGIPWGAGAI